MTASLKLEAEIFLKTLILL